MSKPEKRKVPGSQVAHAGKGAKKVAKADGVVVLPPVDENAEATYVDLFERDDVTYRIPAKPNVGLALRFLKVNATEGQDAGAYFLLSNVLGDEGYDALASYPDLDEKMLMQVLDRAQTVVMGGLELPKAGS